MTLKGMLLVVGRQNVELWWCRIGVVKAISCGW